VEASKIRSFYAALQRLLEHLMLSATLWCANALEAFDTGMLDALRACCSLSFLHDCVDHVAVSVAFKHQK
jgi:hypothetical protein